MRGVYRSRLKERLDWASEGFISSLKTDQQLLPYEIDSSIAHAVMLREQKILTQEQVKKLALALISLRTEKIPLEGFEDIHEYVESAVSRIAGEDAGGRLHTGRSRNDQVATITRMYCRDSLLQLAETLLTLTKTLSRLIEGHMHDPVLSFTHLQHAQVQSLGHHLQSYLAPLVRDLHRILDCYARSNVSPLGASAGAGSTIKVDRRKTAQLLGFHSVLENCQDAVQSRDYAVEAVFIQALIMFDLNRVAEDLIIWSTREFSYYELPDSLSSPSSVMPHKKNADVLEMVRANATKQLANLNQMLTLLKGLPSGYNRDLQNEKETLLDSFPLTLDAIKTTEKCLRLGRFNTKEMAKRAETSEVFALPLAEWLVLSKGIAFRSAHRIAGRIITQSGTTSPSLGKLSHTKLQQLIEDAEGPKLSGKEVSEMSQILTPEGVLEATQTGGGPSEAQLARTQALLNKELRQISTVLSKASNQLANAQKNLQTTSERLMNG